jgi:hypothetical protein
MTWGEYQGMLEDEQRAARQADEQAVEDTEQAAVDQMNQEIYEAWGTSGSTLASDSGLELPQLYEVLASDQFAQVQAAIDDAIANELDEYEIEDVFRELGQAFDPAVLRVGYELNRIRLPSNFNL